MPKAPVASLVYTPARRWHETLFTPQQGRLRDSGARATLRVAGRDA
jgi:hypothetical protein